MRVWKWCKEPSTEFNWYFIGVKGRCPEDGSYQSGVELSRKWLCFFFTSPLLIAWLLAVLPCPVPTAVLDQLFMDSSSKWEQRTPSGLKITWSQKVNCIFNPDQVSRSRTLCSSASACSNTSAEVLRGSLVLLRLFRPGFELFTKCRGLGKQTWHPICGFLSLL